MRVTWTCRIISLQDENKLKKVLGLLCPQAAPTPEERSSESGDGGTRGAGGGEEAEGEGEGEGEGGGFAAEYVGPWEEHGVVVVQSDQYFVPLLALNPRFKVLCILCLLLLLFYFIILLCFIFVPPLCSLPGSRPVYNLSRINKTITNVEAECNK